MLHLSLAGKFRQGTQIDKIFVYMNLISKFIKKKIDFPKAWLGYIDTEGNGHKGLNYLSVTCVMS